MQKTHLFLQAPNQATLMLLKQKKAGFAEAPTWAVKEKKGKPRGDYRFVESFLSPMQEPFQPPFF